MRHLPIEHPAPADIVGGSAKPQPNRRRERSERLLALAARAEIEATRLW